MALRICPKCEVNYLRPDEELCHVCADARRKKQTEKPSADEVIMCSECGEAAALHGKDLCADCLREQQRINELELLADQIRDDERTDPIEDDISDEDDEE